MSEVSRIDQRVISYYKSISQELKNGFSDKEQEELFVGNAIKQLLTKDLSKVVKHQSTSYTLQTLIKKAKADQLEGILRALITDFDAVVVHRSASYVVQTALYAASAFLTSKDDPFFKLINLFGMKLLERSELFSNSYGSHLIRSAIEVMSGVPLPGKVVQGKNANKEMAEQTFKLTQHELYADFEEILLAMAQIVIPSTKAGAGVLNETVMSSTAQAFLTAFNSKNPKISHQFCGQLLDCGVFSEMSEDGLPVLLVGKAGSFFTMLAVRSFSAEQFERFYEESVSEHLMELASHPFANYVIKAVIESVPSEKLFETIMENVGSIEDLMNDAQMVLVQLTCTAGARFPKQQASIMEKLVKASRFKKNDETKRPNLVSYLITGKKSADLSVPEVAKKFAQSNIRISMTIQTLLNFKDSSDIVSSLTSLPPLITFKLADSTYGCYIYTAFFKCSTVPDDCKNKMAEQFAPVSPKLMIAKYGHFVFPEMWRAINMDMKKLIMDVLQTNHNIIRGCRGGIKDLIGFDLCRKDKSRWEKEFSAIETMKAGLLSKDGAEDLLIGTDSDEEEEPAKKVKQEADDTNHKEEKPRKKVKQEADDTKNAEMPVKKSLKKKQNNTQEEEDEEVPAKKSKKTPKKTLKRAKDIEVDENDSEEQREPVKKAKKTPKKSEGMEVDENDSEEQKEPVKKAKKTPKKSEDVEVDENDSKEQKDVSVKKGKKRSLKPEVSDGDESEAEEQPAVPVKTKKTPKKTAKVASPVSAKKAKKKTAKA